MCSDRLRFHGDHKEQAQGVTLECQAFRLTMLLFVASPSRPPNVMTGDMQAQ